MLLKVAELVPKHPGRHKKPGQKTEGASGSSSGGASAGGGGSSKKGKKKK